jgi:antitoxin YefM
MKAVSYSEARNNLKTYLDYVDQSHDAVTIVRQNGKNVVMMSEDDYNSINETLYLLSSANNRKNLLASLNDGLEGSITFKKAEDIEKFFNKKSPKKPK